MPRKKQLPPHMSRRERQVLDLVYRLERATASMIQASLPDQPNYSAVRAILRLLEQKGLLTHEQDGPRYVYRPAISHRQAQKSALKHLVRTFFHGAEEEVVAGLFKVSDLRGEQLDRIAELLEEERRRRRG